MRATSSLGFAGMHPAERLVEFVDHVLKRHSESRPATDQDIIVATTQAFGVRKPYQFA